MSKVDQWVGSIPKVKSWTETLKPSAKKVYQDHLYQYWTNYLY